MDARRTRCVPPRRRSAVSWRTSVRACTWLRLPCRPHPRLFQMPPCLALPFVLRSDPFAFRSNSHSGHTKGTCQDKVRKLQCAL